MEIFYEKTSHTWGVLDASTHEVLAEGFVSEDEATTAMVRLSSPEGSSQEFDASAAADGGPQKQDWVHAARFYWARAYVALTERNFSAMRAMAEQAKDATHRVSPEGALMDGIFGASTKAPEARAVSMGEKITHEQAMKAREAVEAEMARHAERQDARRKKERQERREAAQKERREARKRHDAAAKAAMPEVGQKVEVRQHGKMLGRTLSLVSDAGRFLVDCTNMMEATEKGWIKSDRRKTFMAVVTAVKVEKMGVGTFLGTVEIVGEPTREEEEREKERSQTVDAVRHAYEATKAEALIVEKDEPKWSNPKMAPTWSLTFIDARGIRVAARWSPVSARVERSEEQAIDIAYLAEQAEAVAGELGIEVQIEGFRAIFLDGKNVIAELSHDEEVTADAVLEAMQ